MRTFLLSALIVLAACGAKSDTVRLDVTARMQSASPTITECYRQALRENRKLRGVIVVAFVAAAQTGAFTNVQIVQDDLQSPGLATCVTNAVSGLKLDAPQKTNLSVQYPIDFAPTK